MKGIILSIVMFSLFLSINAQDPFNKLYRTDTDTSFATLFGGVIATDSAYYLAGLTIDLYPKKHNVGLFVKLDLDGNKLIQRTYGDTLLTHEMWFDGFQQTADGNFINTAINRDGSISLIKLNPNGDPLFIKNYYPSNMGYRLFSRGGIAPGPDNGWMLAVTENRAAQHVLLIIATDSLGNEVIRWEYNDLNYSRFGVKILADQDGGFIISSRRTKGDQFFDKDYQNHTHLFKIDSLGNVIWNYFTPLSRWIACTTIKRNIDGGLVLVGTEAFQSTNGQNISYDFLGYVLKINSQHQYLWEKTFGGDFPNAYTYLTDVEIKNGDIYVCGQALTPDITEWVGWMAKLDNEWGYIRYQRHYTHDHLPLSVEDRFLNSMALTDDGGFILAGQIINQERFTKQEGNWGWVLKTDSLGCIEPGCLSVGIGDAPIADEGLIITAYPNPATDQIRFQLDYPEGVLPRASLSLSVYNMLGQKMEERPLGRGESMVELPLQLYPAGVYVYRLTEEGRLLGGGKFVKE